MSELCPDFEELLPSPIYEGKVSLCSIIIVCFPISCSSFLQVVNKWFALQAMSDISGNVENVKSLLNHPAFDLRNPNKVYSLIGGFCGSPVNFHAKDGSGYKFLGEIVLQLDKLNPQVHLDLVFTTIYVIIEFYTILIFSRFHELQVASRMVSAFSRWRRYDETRQNLAKVTNCGCCCY